MKATAKTSLGSCWVLATGRKDRRAMEYTSPALIDSSRTLISESASDLCVFAVCNYAYLFRLLVVGGPVTHFLYMPSLPFFIFSLCSY